MSIILGMRTATPCVFEPLIIKLKKKSNMNKDKNEDLINQINRLLEWLHQSDGQHLGSHITLIKVEKGAQYVNHVGTQVFNTNKSDARVKDCSPTVEPPMPPDLPEQLATPEATALWQKAQQAGYVDGCFQPLLSRTLAALLADTMAERLSIKEKWKVFERLWHRKYMRSDYNLALTRKRSLNFQDELKQLFG